MSKLNVAKNRRRDAQQSAKRNSRLCMTSKSQGGNANSQSMVEDFARPKATNLRRQATRIETFGAPTAVPCRRCSREGAPCISWHRKPCCSHCTREGLPCEPDCSMSDKIQAGSGLQAQDIDDSDDTPSNVPTLAAFADRNLEVESEDQSFESQLKSPRRQSIHPADGPLSFIDPNATPETARAAKRRKVQEDQSTRTTLAVDRSSQDTVSATQDSSFLPTPGQHTTVANEVDADQVIYNQRSAVIDESFESTPMTRQETRAALPFLSSAGHHVNIANDQQTLEVPDSQTPFLDHLTEQRIQADSDGDESLELSDSDPEEDGRDVTSRLRFSTPYLDRTPKHRKSTTSDLRANKTTRETSRSPSPSGEKLEAISGMASRINDRSMASAPDCQSQTIQLETQKSTPETGVVRPNVQVQHNLHIEATSSALPESRQVSQEAVSRDKSVQPERFTRRFSPVTAPACTMSPVTPSPLVADPHLELYRWGDTVMPDLGKNICSQATQNYSQYLDSVDFPVPDAEVLRQMDTLAVDWQTPKKHSHSARHSTLLGNVLAANEDSAGQSCVPAQSDGPLPFENELQESSLRRPKAVAERPGWMVRLPPRKAHRSTSMPSRLLQTRAPGPAGQQNARRGKDGDVKKMFTTYAARQFDSSPPQGRRRRGETPPPSDDVVWDGITDEDMRRIPDPSSEPCLHAASSPKALVSRPLMPTPKSISRKCHSAKSGDFNAGAYKEVYGQDSSTHTQVPEPLQLVQSQISRELASSKSDNAALQARIAALECASTSHRDQLSRLERDRDEALAKYRALQQSVLQLARHTEPSPIRASLQVCSQVSSINDR